LAQQTLSGVIQCSQHGLVSTLLKQFYELLEQSKIPKVKDVVYHQILNKRHAAVLGISAVVLAFPYELPHWMPLALITLSQCSHDPMPIKSTITNTFGEFKRTHQDTWEYDKLLLTPNELSAISDLFYSQSYFV
jgi:proteasome activator subunit 4